MILLIRPVAEAVGYVRIYQSGFINLLQLSNGDTQYSQTQTNSRYVIRFVRYILVKEWLMTLIENINQRENSLYSRALFKYIQWTV